MSQWNPGGQRGKANKPQEAGPHCWCGRTTSRLHGVKTVTLRALRRLPRSAVGKSVEGSKIETIGKIDTIADGRAVAGEGTD